MHLRAAKKKDFKIKTALLSLKNFNGVVRSIQVQRKKHLRIHISLHRSAKESDLLSSSIYSISDRFSSFPVTSETSSVKRWPEA